MNDIVSKLFRYRGHGCEMRVVRMDYPYLLQFAFDSRKGLKFDPASLWMVLKACCKQYLVAGSAAEDSKRARELLLKGLDTLGDESKSPNGIFGLDHLDELSSLCTATTKSAETARIQIGLMQAVLEVRRFGDCLAIKPIDKVGQGHSSVSRILDSVMGTATVDYLRHFVHRIGFSIEPRFVYKERNAVLDVVQEIDAMRLQVPTFKWVNPKKLAGLLLEDFIEGDECEREDGVCVATYGDASIWMSIHQKTRQVNKQWRRGTVVDQTDTAIVFDRDCGADCRIEYFVRTIEHRNPFLHEVDHTIDYPNEQRLMEDLARKLYVGLDDRLYEAMRKNNPHVSRLRKQGAESKAA